MPLARLPLRGQRQQLMRFSFAVLAAELLLAELGKFGLIDALRLSERTTTGSGRSFTSANASEFGGLGVAIAPLQNTGKTLLVLEFSPGDRKSRRKNYATNK